MSYQSTTILGNVGNDAEMRYTPSGVPVTNFSVAVNRRWTTTDGQQQEKTTWFRVTTWRKLAEVCGEYVHKGMQVLVVGEIEEPNVYTAKDGTQRSNLELTANTVRFVGGKREEGEQAGPRQQEQVQTPVLDDVESIPW
jgi:single-strand DNA-binding protein